MDRYRRIGLMGGSFDPVHNGHLALAISALDTLQLDRLLMIPVGTPPHKPAGCLSAAQHRLAMLERAVAGIPHIGVSRVELDKDGVSYTADTLRILKRQYGENAELTLIIGADQLMELETWREAPELFRLCRIAAAFRPGVDTGQMVCRMNELQVRYGGQLVLLEAPLLDISSTAVRGSIRAGQPVRQWLPEAVWQYIQEQHLYTG